MNAHFQNLFENVCRCFGHTPTSMNPGGGMAGEPLETSATLNQSNKGKNDDPTHPGNQSAHGQPPRHEMNKRRHASGADQETAKALAQAKLAANPPRYRTKRKRSSQTREEIFRMKNASGGTSGGAKSSQSSSNNNRNSSSSGPVTDFSRLLNPSLALCFATPVRGTEEEQEEQDMKSVDYSDTATLNTNGEDTITSTLYFDSKYAHIQESTPPMKLFNEFKLGQDKDEIRTIMATDSHSSVRMMHILQQQQQQHQQRQRHERDHKSSDIKEGGGMHSSSNSAVQRKSRNHSDRGVAENTALPATTSARTRSGRKETISIRNKDDSNFVDRDEEMQDAVPDMKPVSSSTDSSRLSANATARN